MQLIFGGDDADITEFPSVVSLKIRQRIPHAHTVFNCGGVILNDRWALTTAHCVYNVPKEGIFVRSGSDFYSIGGTLHTVSKIIVHEDYTPRRASVYDDILRDIAAVQVPGSTPDVNSVLYLCRHLKQLSFHLTRFIEDTFPMNKHTVMPAKLPTPGQLILPGTKGVTIGWGETSLHRYSEKLQKLDVVVTSATDDTIIATEGGETGGAKGDSGSPLFVDGILIGLLSTISNDCSPPDMSNTFTRISLFRDWILDKTGV